MRLVTKKVPRREVRAGIAMREISRWEGAGNGEVGMEEEESLSG